MGELGGFLKIERAPAPERDPRERVADYGEIYQLLVGQRGWTPQRYERFLSDTWQRLLLAD